MYANGLDFRVFRKSGSRNTMVTSDLDRKWKYGRFVHAQCIRP